MLKQNIRRFIISTFILFFSTLTFAQNQPGGMDDTMRSHDKIYVVLAVCLVILITVLLYLIRIDIKLSKKEKTNP